MVTNNLSDTHAIHASLPRLVFRNPILKLDKGVFVVDVSKRVRFYEAVKLNQRDTRLPIANGFWTTFAEELEAKDPADREHQFNRVVYVGEAKSPVSPATPYIQVSRVRSPSEQLDRYNPETGRVEPLEFDNPSDRVAEPTYIVPFGLHNYVAVMSPAIRATRPEAIDSWLTEMCGLTLTENRVELRPIIDENTLSKILNARGATKLNLRVEKDSVIPSGGGIMGNAVREAALQTTDETTLEMTWSFGHSKGSLSAKEKLLEAAQWIAQGGFTEKAAVSIEVEGPDGEFKSELHNIFMDRVTKTIQFEVDEGSRPSDTTVLLAIVEAIQEFNRSSTNVVGSN
jgi:hypothetical protein